MIQCNMHLHNQLDLLPFLRAYLRQRPQHQALAKIHRWKDLATAVKPFLLRLHIELPSNLPHWLGQQHQELEDASTPSLADIPFVFHDYCENRQQHADFVTALRQRQWTTAAKLVSQHTLCSQLPFAAVYNFFINNGEERCQLYDIPVSQEPGVGQAAVKPAPVREQDWTDTLLKPLADDIGLYDEPVYAKRHGLSDACLEKLWADQVCSSFSQCHKGSRHPAAEHRFNCTTCLPNVSRG